MVQSRKSETTPSDRKTHPVPVRLAPKDLLALKAISKHMRLPVSWLIREGVYLIITRYDPPKVPSEAGQ